MFSGSIISYFQASVTTIMTDRAVSEKLSYNQLKIEFDELKGLFKQVLKFIDIFGLREKLEAFLNPEKSQKYMKQR